MIRIISKKANKPFQNPAPDEVSLQDGDREWEISRGYDPNSTQTYQANPNDSMSGTRQRLVQIGKAMNMLQQELANLTQELLDTNSLG